MVTEVRPRDPADLALGPKDAMLREYQTEIAKLKELLEKGGPSPPIQNGVSMSTGQRECKLY